MDENKVVTLGNLKTAVDEIGLKYPTKEAVTEEIRAASLGENIHFATTEDVLALFNPATPEQTGSEGTGDEQGV